MSENEESMTDSEKNVLLSRIERAEENIKVQMDLMNDVIQMEESANKLRSLLIVIEELVSQLEVNQVCIAQQLSCIKFNE